ncbi:hypothetical protein DK59_3184 [Brucella abortus bv. 4 str. 292]|nr:hypothetical protein DK59_3184 [Brucella abortus bv. 4 str. 292]
MLPEPSFRSPLKVSPLPDAPSSVPLTVVLPPISPLPSSVAPLFTVTVPPSLPLTRSEPLDTVVVPAKPWLSPLSVSAPAPFCTRLPVPEISPAKVVPPLLWKVSVPALATLPASLPSVLPSPSCSVLPLAIVVLPL